MKKLALLVAMFSASVWAKYPDLPKAVADGGGALIGDVAYVGLGSAEADFYSLDLKADNAQWQTLPTFPAGGRTQPVVVSLDGKLYVFGGLQKNEAGVLQLVHDAHIFDPAKNEWQALPTRAPFGLVGASGFAHDKKIYFVGGVNTAIFNGYFQDYTGSDEAKKKAVMEAYFNQKAEDYFFNQILFSYEPEKNQWHNEGVLPFSGRAGASVKINGTGVYVANGEIKPGLRTNEVEFGVLTKDKPINWLKMPELIAGEGQKVQEGLAGAYAGFFDGYYLLTGGANFTGAREAYDSGKFYAHEGLKRYYDENIYILNLDTHNKMATIKMDWRVVGKLPVPAGYGVSLNYGEKVVLFGGKGHDGNLSSVITLTFDGKELKID